jgi:hypothetical protein
VINMNITPPLGYGPIVLLRKDMRLRESTGLPAFASRLNVMPMTAGELPLASHDYPVMFVRVGDTERYAMIAVLGWAPEENLFIENGNWLPGVYCPAYIRRHPFCLTRTPTTAGQPGQSLVSIEQSAVGDEGASLFDEQGKPTPRFLEIEQFLNEYEGELERTREQCSIFADFKLFEHMPMAASISGQTFSTQGLYRIDEKRLDLLNANQMKTLLRKGALATIYQHLGSVTRFSRLIDRKLMALVAEGQGNPSAPTA